jgi:hypothetical protein
MAIRHITSDPKPSSRHNGWLYAYYSKPTRTGGDCTVVLPPAIADVIRKGFAFDDSCITYDESLGASVLQLDFDKPAHLGEPALPADPETGWGDPDRLPASPPQLSGNHQEPLHTGHRPATLRRHDAARSAIEGAQLPADFLKINLEVNRSFLMQYALISPAVGEARRADVAQKLCAIASIPYYRQKGVALTDDDVKAITAY